MISTHRQHESPICRAQKHANTYWHWRNRAPRKPNERQQFQQSFRAWAHGQNTLRVFDSTPLRLYPSRTWQDFWSAGVGRREREKANIFGSSREEKTFLVIFTHICEGCPKTMQTNEKRVRAVREPAHPALQLYRKHYAPPHEAFTPKKHLSIYHLPCAHTRNFTVLNHMNT